MDVHSSTVPEGDSRKTKKKNQTSSTSNPRLWTTTDRLAFVLWEKTVLYARLATLELLLALEGRCRYRAVIFQKPPVYDGSTHNTYLRMSKNAILNLGFVSQLLRQEQVGAPPALFVHSGCARYFLASDGPPHREVMGSTQMR